MRMLGVLSRVGDAAPMLDGLRDRLGLCGARVSSSGPAGVLLVGEASPPVAMAAAPDGSFAVVDGELFSGLTSAEELLSAWRSRGRDVLPELGMEAACALWDAKENRLSLVRDRLGVVPLYWARTADAVLWSSDLSMVARAGHFREVDMVTLDTFLATARTLAPRSWLQGVAKVPGATCIELAPEGEAREHVYWRQTARPAVEDPAAVSDARLLDLLTESVARRLVPGETGLLLSAGVDSTLLAAVAASRLGAEVNTFTFRYAGHEGSLNEGAAARETAHHLGLPHHEIEVTPVDVEQRFSELVPAFGEPFTYGLHSFGLGAVREHGVSGVISGAGSDGLHGLGRRATVAMTLRRAPAPVRRLALAGVAGVRSVSNRAADRAGAPFVYAYEAARVSLINTQARARLYREPAAAHAGRDALYDQVRVMERCYAGETADDRDLFVTQYLDCEMVSLWNARWARVHGVAVRAAFSDNDFVERFLRTPRGTHDEKPVTRRLAAQLVPPHIAHRPKIAQTIPVGEWFRGPLEGFLRDRLSRTRIEDAGLFEPDEVTRIVDTHLRGEVDYTWWLVALLTVTEWKLSLTAA